MAPHITLGSVDVQNPQITETFVPGSAETIVKVYEGTREAIDTLYTTLKSQGVNAVKSVVGGRCSITTNEIFDPNANVIGDVSFVAYSLVPVELLRKIGDHPYFLSGSFPPFTNTAALTADQIMAVYSVWYALSDYPPTVTALAKKTEWEGTTPGGDAGKKMVELLSYLTSGREEYPYNEFILRETKEVGIGSVERVDYVGVNLVGAIPNTSAANAVIGNLATLGGEWLKRTPAVERVSQTRYHITTEWWWSLKWAKIPYNGTFDPYSTIA